MRMNSKVLVFIVAFVLGGLVLGAVGLWTGVGPLPALLWFGAFGIAQLFVLRCPYCGRSATRLRGDVPWHVPWAGSRCRHCGKDY